MKRLFYLMLMVLGTMAFVSCSDDENNEISQEPVYHYGEITINTTPSIEYDGSANNTVSLTIRTFNEGDEISIDYGSDYTPTVTSTKDEYNNYTYELKYTFPDEEDHTITIKGNISEIYCYHDNYHDNGTYITSLDVSGCTALEALTCSDNQLTSLDVSKNTALTFLDCGGNQLTSLDVSRCTTLERLFCSDNQLTSLDVSGCMALTDLICDNNQLTSLDVSKNTALIGLQCDNNQLTSLDVSKNTALILLSCSDNQFTAAEMNKIYEALPTVGGGSLYCDQLGNPGIAEQKGWGVSFE